MVASREDDSARANGGPVAEDDRSTVFAELGGVRGGHHLDLSSKSEGVEPVGPWDTFVIHAVVPVGGESVAKNRVWRDGGSVELMEARPRI